MQRDGQAPSLALALGPVSDSCPGSVLVRLFVGRIHLSDLPFAPSRPVGLPCMPQLLDAGTGCGQGWQCACGLLHKRTCLLYPPRHKPAASWASCGVALLWLEGQRPRSLPGPEGDADTRRQLGTHVGSWGWGVEYRSSARVLSAACGFSPSPVWPFLHLGSRCLGMALTGVGGWCLASRGGLLGAPMLGALLIHLVFIRHLMYLLL